MGANCISGDLVDRDLLDLTRVSAKISGVDNDYACGLEGNSLVQGILRFFTNIQYCKPIIRRNDIFRDVWPCSIITPERIAYCDDQQFFLGCQFKNG